MAIQNYPKGDYSQKLNDLSGVEVTTIDSTEFEKEVALLSVNFDNLANKVNKLEEDLKLKDENIKRVANTTDEAMRELIADIKGKFDSVNKYFSSVEDKLKALEEENAKLKEELELIKTKQEEVKENKEEPKSKLNKAFILDLNSLDKLFKKTVFGQILG